MALHSQPAAFLAAYSANAPSIDYDTVMAAELRRLFNMPKPEIVSARLRGVEDCGRRAVQSAPFPGGLTLTDLQNW